MTLRQRLYSILENNDDVSWQSRMVEYFLIGLIILNVLAVIASSMHWVYSFYDDYFDWFENFSIGVFSLEFVLRAWVMAEKKPANLKELDPHRATAWHNRWHWLTSPAGLVDFFAIMPAYVNFFVSLDLRFLIVLRLLRLFKLARHFSALRLLLKVILREKEAFKAVLFILMVLIVLSASAMYLVENKVQPEHFGSIPQAMWWAVVTLTTVGYGDVTPVTPLGKTVGALITVLGVGVAALPAGILASGLSSELTQQREDVENQLREKILSANFDLHDYKAHRSPKVAAQIETMRKDLNLTHEQAVMVVKELLEDLETENFEDKPNFCPNCGYCLKKDG